MLGYGQNFSWNEAEFLETLQAVDRLSQITFLQQNLNLFLIKLNIFFLADIPQFLHLGLEGNRFESEFNAPGYDRLDNSGQRRGVLGDVVADDAESGGLGVVLHDPSECTLGFSGHEIGFVQDDHLVGRAFVISISNAFLLVLWLYAHLLGESFDFISNNCNTPFV